MRYRAYLSGAVAHQRGEDVDIEWLEFSTDNDADAWAKSRAQAASLDGTVTRLVARPGKGQPDREVANTTEEGEK